MMNVLDSNKTDLYQKILAASDIDPIPTDYLKTKIRP